jgi:2-C-methyl-D-erythritol 2,4-cyclodiphosphate synthase
MFAEGDNMFRIGQSIDIHQLVEGRDLYIGGVKIDHDKGLLGHSDADVLLHAIIESIIGALGLGDMENIFQIRILNIKEFLQWFYWNIVIN